MNNPPAFPIADVRTHDGFGLREGSDGMTLLDWFAGQALPLVAETYPEWQLKEWFGGRSGLTREEIRATAAYRLAKAMLLARP